MKNEPRLPTPTSGHTGRASRRCLAVCAAVCGVVWATSLVGCTGSRTQLGGSETTNATTPEASSPPRDAGAASGSRSIGTSSGVALDAALTSPRAADGGASSTLDEVQTSTTTSGAGSDEAVTEATDDVDTSTGGEVNGGVDGGVRPPTMAPNLTDVTKLQLVPCTIESGVTLAAKIPMVGVATFATNLEGADRATIQFGTATRYLYEAPVAWDEVDHRTLLVGMPADTEVHYRVIVWAGEHACVSADSEYVTGGPVAGVLARVPTQDGPSPVAPAPGFIIGGRSDVAYIVSKEGEVVWAHRFPASLTRVTLSWDGKYVLARDMGPFNAGAGGSLFRVNMDGTDERRLSLSGGHHHDFTSTPEGIVYIAKDAPDSCDSLYTARVDGSDSAPLVNLAVVFDKFDFGGGAITLERCHVNYVRYYHDTERFSVSDREKDAIAIFSKTGALLASIGAAPRQTTPNHVLAQGADSSVNAPWRVQHGHDWYAPNKLVLWSNGPFQKGQSRLLHYTLSGNTATLDWQYTATGTSSTLGDGFRLPNGNFLGANTTTGTVHEIDGKMKLVRSYSGLTRAYPVYRRTLYGSPSDY